jgi:hypothetical protein
MTANYNEIDPKAAATLRELIKRGIIAQGVVDERSLSMFDEPTSRDSSNVISSQAPARGVIRSPCELGR